MLRCTFGEKYAVLKSKSSESTAEKHSSVESQNGTSAYAPDVRSMHLSLSSAESRVTQPLIRSMSANSRNGRSLRMRKSHQEDFKTRGRNSLKSEIEKINTLFDKGYTLKKEDLSRTLGAERVETIFNLIDKISPGSEKAALESLLKVLSSGLEDPSRLLYRLIRHFMAILKIKAGVTGGDYRMRILKKQADRFSVSDVLIWLENLRRVDIIMKSTSFPQTELMVAAFGHSMHGKVLTGTPDEVN